MPVSFEWDPRKDRANQEKHGVSFAEGQRAFFDRHRIIAEDLKHSTPKERRYYCYGNHGGGILTVRFTYRGGIIRIFGAGYWTKGRRIYEQENQIHKGPRRSREDR
ncbi:MAG: BrnT family toxin [Steroidobacteraceae bacterium]